MHSSESLSLDNPFWQFSLKVYQQTSVKECCLLLQNSQGANVNLLLFCCWLSFFVDPISHEEFKQACDSIGVWHQQITTTLRQARQHAKTFSNNVWVRSFYNQLLTQEINSEAYQQDMLYSHFSNRPLVFKKDETLALRYLSWLFEDMGVVVDKKLNLQLKNFIDLILNTFTSY
ncbi:TIGR02444 family protein [Legionella hackeliae]|uniref:TIGR02444 family protein n=1 Tax=Legionella hackeliae TaxID=449 RepID=A0A0A8UR22_LEGHA|nr:TIGR02444 family protein [Legionella hackeliae]KTD14842.1 hypothetical protein Lhac_0372 [Legionella hackeliae]CEK09532.1 protein of unknown function [Legionella hackeliae]STX49439.1 Uncharacterized conserved protein [Legionella hackeliae]